MVRARVEGAGPAWDAASPRVRADTPTRAACRCRFLSGWHYRTIGVKKPFNPIIGETFACYWKHADGSRSQYFAEQVGVSCVV